MDSIKNTPLLSIIIPSFNSLDKLKSCLVSIKNQTFKDFEVLIIDGDSNDGTQEFLKGIEHPFFWVSEKDKGIYDAMNKGIDASKGKWLLFLGCDDIIYNKNTLKNIFNKDIGANYKLVIGKIKYCYSSNDSFFLKNKSGIFNSSWSKLLWIYNTAHHQSILYRKEVFLLKKYSLEYKILADYNLNLYLFNKGVQVLKVSEIISLCGTSGISKIYNWRLYEEEIDLKIKNSSSYLKPFFYSFIYLKFIIKKIV